jgi:hypothetical protein
MTAQFSTPTDELLLLAETLGEVKTRTEKLEGEFSTHAKPLEAATNALSAALSGIKALQFHVLDNNLGALSARVEEMRKAVDEQVGVIALELKKADETNAAKAGADAEALRSEIVALQSQLGSLVTQFGQQLERVEFAAKEEAKKLQLIPGPAGAAGASLNPRGTFIDGEVYNRLDVVSWLGSSYIATVDGVTEKPSKNSNQWQTLASRGGGGAGGVGDFGSLAGVAQINQGGTGQTTRALALNALLPDQAGSTQYMLLTDGSGTVSWGAQPVAGLPSQTSNSGRLLTTNGTTASWSNAVTVSGSNATVGGTLTVSGTGSSTVAGKLVVNPLIAATKSVEIQIAHAINTENYLRVASDNGSSFGAEYGYGLTGVGDPEIRINRLHAGTVTNVLKIRTTNGAATLAGSLSITDTTASTSTSSGALVVGNGTSGGLGVGGAITLGGRLNAFGTTAALTHQIYVYNQLASTTNAALSGAQYNAQPGYSTFVGVTGNGTNASYQGSIIGSAVVSEQGYVISDAVRGLLLHGINGGIKFATNNPGTQVGSISNAGVWTIDTTTDSTTKSDGALVVSGGVGVEKNIIAGSGIAARGTLTLPAAWTGSYGIGLEHNNATATSRIFFGDGTGYTLKFASRSSSTTTDRMTLTDTGNLTVVGSLTTGAPSGGTAAAWKLGTVATVSPTSPNRTIEVDIGGTIYYIHAKTTNN